MARLRTLMLPAHAPAVLAPLVLALGILATGPLVACGSPPAGIREDAQRAWMSKEIGLHVSEHGVSGATVVVPGASWVEMDFDPILADRRVVFYDARGQGRSTEIPDDDAIRLDEDITDLERLRLQLGVERMALVGWSYNGAVALHYALRYPERVERLVLIGPTPPRRNPHMEESVRRLQDRRDAAAYARIDDWRASGRKEEELASFCRAFTELVVDTYAYAPGAFARMRSDPCVEPNLDPDASALVRARTLQSLGAWDWRPLLGRLQVPVLLIHGRENPIPIEASMEYAMRLPQGRLLVLDECGHFPWLEKPALFFAALSAFLDGTWPEGAQVLRP